MITPLCHLLKTVTYGKDIFVEITDENKKSLITNVAQIHSNSDFIYSLIFDEVKDKVIELGDDFRPKLAIWDWEGNVVGSFQLDKPIIGFTVDKDNKYLYGVALQSMNTIYKFKLEE